MQPVVGKAKRGRCVCSILREVKGRTRKRSGQRNQIPRDTFKLPNPDAGRQPVFGQARGALAPETALILTRGGPIFGAEVQGSHRCLSLVNLKFTIH